MEGQNTASLRKPVRNSVQPIAAGRYCCCWVLPEMINFNITVNSPMSPAWTVLKPCCNSAFHYVFGKSNNVQCLGNAELPTNSLWSSPAVSLFFIWLSLPPALYKVNLLSLLRPGILKQPRRSLPFVHRVKRYTRKIPLRSVAVIFHSSRINLPQHFSSQFKAIQATLSSCYS